MDIADDRQQKIDRELRLMWQSRTLLAAVLLISAYGLLARLLPVLTPANAEGLIICAAFGVLVWLLRAATPAAALTGFLLTASLYTSTVAQPRGGWLHTALLPGLALFVLAFVATRFRHSQKEQIGVAESRRGRGASQVAANMGVAALVALTLPSAEGSKPLHLGICIGHLVIPSAALLTAMVAALAEAAADTVSSELGQAVGGQPVLIISGHRVLPGVDGAITLAGTAAGGVAAAIVVCSAVPTLHLIPRQAMVGWVASIAGLFVDSLIGATLERRGWLNNDSVNFLSTATSALIAVIAVIAVIA